MVILLTLAAFLSFVFVTILATADRLQTKSRHAAWARDFWLMIGCWLCVTQALQARGVSLQLWTAPSLWPSIGLVLLLLGLLCHARRGVRAAFFQGV